MNDLFKMPNIKDDCNFWMVRTKSGWFYNEFIRDEFIAIGWNSIDKAAISNYGSSEELKQRIKRDYAEKRPGSALNKCRRFIYDVKENDIVMIVGQGKMTFAVVGKYFENNQFTLANELETNKKIETSNITSEFTTCPYNKRRKIKVITEIEESKINPYLYKASAVNMHSLSSLNDYAERILSACYDIYIWKNNISITFRVEKESSIDAFHLAEFINSTAKLVSNRKEYDIAIKTSLYSPGDIILQIFDFAKDNALLIAIAYFVIFGGKFKDCEFNSIFGLVKSIMNRKHNDRLKELEIENQELQNQKLEQEIIGQKIQNETRKHDNQINLVSETLPDIYKTSQELKITPRDGNIISIEQFKSMLDGNADK